MTTPDEGPEPQAGQAEQRPKKKNWFLRHKFITGLLAVAVLVIIIAVNAGGGDDNTTSSGSQKSTSGGSSGNPKASTSSKPTAKPSSKPSSKPKPEPKKYGDGTYRVREDIPAGTYRSSETTDLCYWATLKGFSGDLNDIIKNGNNSPAIVSLEKSTKGFQSTGCGDWVDVSATYPPKPASSFGDGAYIVGKHIKPGEYRAAGGGDNCYWARLSTFKGGGITGILANGNEPTIVDIKPSDRGFEAYGCGRWAK
jgi:hypothetical protein